MGNAAVKGAAESTSDFEYRLEDESYIGAELPARASSENRDSFKIRMQEAKTNYEREGIPFIYFPRSIFERSSEYKLRLRAQKLTQELISPKAFSESGQKFINRMVFEVFIKD